MNPTTENICIFLRLLSSTYWIFTSVKLNMMSFARLHHKNQKLPFRLGQLIWIIYHQQWKSQINKFKRDLPTISSFITDRAHTGLDRKISLSAHASPRLTRHQSYDPYYNRDRKVSYGGYSSGYNDSSYSSTGRSTSSRRYIEDTDVDYSSSYSSGRTRRHSKSSYGNYSSSNYSSGNYSNTSKYSDSTKSYRDNVHDLVFWT